MGAASTKSFSPSTLQSKTRSGFSSRRSRQSSSSRLEAARSSDEHARGRRGDRSRRRSSSGAGRSRRRPRSRRNRSPSDDHLDVGAGALGTEHLDAELAELAEPPRLWPPVPELRADVVRLEGDSAAPGRAPGRRAPPTPCSPGGASATARPCPRTCTSPSSRRRRSSPEVRANSSVCSNIGVSTYRNPNSRASAMRLVVQPEHRVGTIGQQVLRPARRRELHQASPAGTGSSRARARPWSSAPWPGRHRQLVGERQEPAQAAPHVSGSTSSGSPSARSTRRTPDRPRAARHRRTGSSNARACAPACGTTSSGSRRTRGRRRRRSCAGPSRASSGFAKPGVPAGVVGTRPRRPRGRRPAARRRERPRPAARGRRARAWQDRDRRLPAASSIARTRLGLEPGVDDDRVIAPVGREQPAVRAVRVVVEDVEPHGAAMLTDRAGSCRTEPRADSGSAASRTRVNGPSFRSSTSMWLRTRRVPPRTPRALERDGERLDASPRREPGPRRRSTTAAAPSARRRTA